MLAIIVRFGPLNKGRPKICGSEFVKIAMAKLRPGGSDENFGAGREPTFFMLVLKEEISLAPKRYRPMLCTSL